MNDRDAPTARLMAGAVKAEPWRYAANVVIWATIWLMPVIPALIVRAFFEPVQNLKRAAEHGRRAAAPQNLGQIIQRGGLVLGAGIALGGQVGADHVRLRHARIAEGDAPFGPLRLNFSQALKKEPGDVEREFDITVRTEF